MALLHEIFSPDRFMPHACCFLWDSSLIRLHVISDALIFLSYLSIPFTLAYFVRKRADIPFSGIFLCFGVFIVSCGMTHLMDIWTLWYPAYWLSGAVKAITAVASLGTAYLLARIVPQALALPSPTQLIASEDKFRRLLEAAPDGIVIVDKDGKIVLANNETEKLFGYSRDELLGKTIDILVPDRFRDKHREQRKIYMRDPVPRRLGAQMDLWSRRKDGSEFLSDISLSPMKVEDGFWTIAAIRDISDRKRAEAALKDYASRLERSNHDLEDFAYAASHDLQEPLRKVSSYCELLALRYKGKIDENADEYIRFAVDGARRMRALIDALLNYARVSTKASPFQPVSMDSALTQALENLSEALRLSGGSVESDPLPTILADEVQMVQLFQNLIGNAIKFKDSRPLVVRVQARREGARWRFSVSDNGIGIEAQYLGKMFTLFQRLHTQSQYPGTGIGLALCKKIVERHNGGIGVESRFGEGTTVWFSLPADEAAHA